MPPNTSQEIYAYYEELIELPNRPGNTMPRLFYISTQVTPSVLSGMLDTAATKVGSVRVQEWLNTLVYEPPSSTPEPGSGYYLPSQLSFLMFAIMEGNLGLAEVLINHGADVNLSTDNFQLSATPLNLAIIRQNLGLVNLLLEQGANPNVREACFIAVHDWAHEGAIFQRLVEQLQADEVPLDQVTNISGRTLLEDFRSYIRDRETFAEIFIAATAAGFPTTYGSNRTLLHAVLTPRVPNVFQIASIPVINYLLERHPEWLTTVDTAGHTPAALLLSHLVAHPPDGNARAVAYDTLKLLLSAYLDQRAHTPDMMSVIDFFTLAEDKQPTLSTALEGYERLAECPELYLMVSSNFFPDPLTFAHQAAIQAAEAQEVVPPHAAPDPIPGRRSP